MISMQAAAGLQQGKLSCTVAYPPWTPKDEDFFYSKGSVGSVVAAADLYEAQCEAMRLVLPLNPVNNEKAAGSALQCPNIQQGFQKRPWRAHSCKEGWPHLGVCLARHTHHHVSKDWEVPNQLCCSLQQRACRCDQAGLRYLSQVWCN